MKVRILGCHGSVAPEYETSCYFINDRFLIDAGSLCSSLSLQEQQNISDILITHPHMDHIKDLCFLLENTQGQLQESVTVYSSPGILNALQTHVFNNIIWPDFSKIPLEANSDTFMLKLVPIVEDVELGGVKISMFKVNRSTEAVGYLIDDGEGQLIFTGDTGPCATIWEIANRCSRLKAIFTHVSYPSDMKTLAEFFGHFTLEQLLRDMQQFKSSQIPIYVGNLKPLFLREMLDEFYSKAPEQLKLLHQDDEYQFI